MTPVTREGRRCCERYDALMARLPDYEAAVEALDRLVRYMKVWHPTVNIEGQTAALARLRDEVTA